jgi:hypothetical protein
MRALTCPCCFVCFPPLSLPCAAPPARDHHRSRRAAVRAARLVAHGAQPGRGCGGDAELCEQRGAACGAGVSEAGQPGAGVRLLPAGQVGRWLACLLLHHAGIVCVSGVWVVVGVQRVWTSGRWCQAAACRTGAGLGCSLEGGELFCRYVC